MKNSVERYLNVDSFVHRLDPRLKIIITIMYIVFTFMARYFITLGLIFIPLVIAFIASSKQFKPVFKLLKMPIFIGVIIFFVNVYTMKLPDPANYPVEGTYPYHIWWRWTSTYAVTYESTARTLALMARIYIMIMVTSLLILSTKPILLTKALEDLMLPLRLLFIPTHIIAMIISIALRFIPTLLEEAQRIMKAQASRGVDFKNGRLKDKTKSFVTLIIPLFVSSFAKAEDLANAMETRGYNPYAKRTRYRKLIPTWRDLIALIIVGGLLALVICEMKIGVNYLPNWYLITDCTM